MRILVIKSASIERLDCLLDSLKLPDGASIEILTHPHMARNLRMNYTDTRVVEYPFSGSFSKSNVRQMLRDGKLPNNYDSVIVPVSNISGTGHFNVISAALLFGGCVELFNVNGDFIEVNKSAFLRNKATRILLFPAVVSATLLLSIWGFLKLASGFLRISLSPAAKANAYGK